jgi:hypothetical protein
MTLTDTVSSFAHDAANAASDLGSQAVELGRSAADVGLDAASSVAAAAGHLAQSLGKKAPPLSSRRKSRAPWLIAIIVAAVAAGAVVMRDRRANRAATNPAGSERIEMVPDEPRVARVS